MLLPRPCVCVFVCVYARARVLSLFLWFVEPQKIGGGGASEGGGGKEQEDGWHIEHKSGYKQKFSENM